MLQILRCLIQPLEERVAPKPPNMNSFAASGSSSAKPRQRYVHFLVRSSEIEDLTQVVISYVIY